MLPDASPNSPSPVATRVFHTLGAILMVIAVLYLGKSVLVPVALSVLLAFVIAPIVKVLEQWKLGRTLAVLSASALAFALILAAGWAIFSQVQKLATDLPNHKQEIKSKIESFKSSDDSTIGRLTKMFDELFPVEIPEGSLTPIDAPAIDTAPVVVVNSRADAPTPVVKTVSMLLPVVQPLAISAMIVVLVIFLLLQREDVRYRIISLLGASALTGTTRLMRDAAERVSKYLLYLMAVNAAFGLWFGLGLYLLGVPYAPLWGFLTLCLRFIPFVGSPASVLLPFLVSVATSTGWSQPLWLLLFFTASEMVTVNVIEPILFGKTTGLTAIALLVAALFWAWVWGPVGLLLSTPLTVCLVVMGQHIPHLRSLKVLLAEQPVLDARLQFFQRLLAGDVDEAKKVATNYAAEMGRACTYDEVIIPALRWTRREREKGNILASEEKFIMDSAREAVATIEADPSTEPTEGDETTSSPMRIYNYPVHHEAEEIALDMFDGVMIAKHYDITLGSTKQLPSRALSAIESSRPHFIVLTVLPPGGLPQVTFMCEEIRKRCTDTPVVVAYLGKIRDYDELLVKLRGVGASYLTTSMMQTRQQIDMLRDDLLDLQPDDKAGPTNE